MDDPQIFEELEDVTFTHASQVEQTYMVAEVADGAVEVSRVINLADQQGWEPWHFVSTQDNAVLIVFVKQYPYALLEA